jgi:hypothetical protein
MRKLSLSLATLAALAVAGCGGVRSPVTWGCLYTDLTGPEFGTVTNNTAAAKTSGTAIATNILGWVATGDASHNAACKKGNISKIAYVDYKATTILGLFSTYTTVVYGE